MRRRVQVVIGRAKRGTAAKTKGFQPSFRPLFFLGFLDYLSVKHWRTKGTSHTYRALFEPCLIWFSGALTCKGPKATIFPNLFR